VSVETCLDEDALFALVSRRATNLVHAQSHLDRCCECRGVFAELVRASRPSVPRGGVVRAAVPSRADPRRQMEAGDPLMAEEIVAERFVLQRPLGEGATGAVWSARDLADGSPRALKFLRTASVDQVRRMRREATVLRAMRHPSIVFAHEIVETARRGPALVMELLEGQSLEARLAGGRTMTLGELGPIARGILSALAAAHARGVVHRDLKPANVFLERGDAEARVRVLDFGMAKLGSGWQSEGLTPGITRSGTVMGTPLYMAPEQVFCERDLDGRADLWSFGVILYRALSGRLPIEAHTFAGLMKALSSGAVRPFHAASTTPRELAELVGRLLSIDRAGRPSSEELILFFERLA
jgi:serine/threonine-protein kinase